MPEMPGSDVRQPVQRHAPAAVSHEPIALVGIGCRLPGADGPDAFWRLLADRTDTIREIPPNRFDLATYYHPEPGTPGRTYSRWGGFIDGVDRFDAEFFGLSPREVERMDPQQRILLEVAWEALEDAGMPPTALAGTSTGMFLGQIAGNYWDLQTRSTTLDIYSMIGSGARAVLSGRVSYALDLRGPSMSIDTACSSSLVAVHLACQSLRTGESEVAVAGGVNLVLLPEESITYSQARMLAPDGRCKFADASANGFVRSDGVGLVVLKPLSRAVADGDRIYALIAGSATNNDGQGSGYLMTPAEDGQERLLRAALADAGVNPTDVDYVEAHGTGTSVGDAVELRALASVVGSGAGRAAGRPCLVGSVKTNIGHAEGAAGVAGLIKVALGLHHRRIPVSLHLAEPNPALDWDGSALAVATEEADWPDEDRPAVAGVSSFGISGSNAHVVLVSAAAADAVAGAAVPAETGTEAAHTADQVAGTYLMPVSARSAAALRALAGAYAERIEACDDPAEVAAVCAAAACDRAHHSQRVAVTGGDAAELAAALRAVAADGSVPDDPDAPEIQVAFVFPGQGSQWVGMGRELLGSSPVFRAAVEECDRAIAAETDWSLLAVLEGDQADRLEELDVVQPTLWAMQVCLATLWRSWGVNPDVVLGHSMGEVAAAHIAGALDLADAAAVICRRSRLARRLSGSGAMAVVELPADEAAASLAGREGLVSIAAHNSPRSTVLSGDAEALTELLAELEARDVFCRLVRVDFASHSAQMDPIRDDLLDALAELRPMKAHTDFHSTVLGRRLTGDELDAAYWADNIRRPVLFAEAVRTIAEAGPTVFIEVSPHPVIAPAVNETLTGSGLPGQALGSLRREQPERAALLDTLAELYGQGAAIDWAQVVPGPRRHVDLPRYPWQRESFWFSPEPNLAHSPAAQATPAARAPHPLLGRPVPVEGAHCWEGPLDRDTNAYLDEHRVQGEVILPGTAYLELVHAAVCEVLGDTPVTLADVTYRTALFLPAREKPDLRVRLEPGADGALRFSVHSRPAGGEWRPHAVGTARREAAAGQRLDLEAVRTRCAEHVTGPDFYAAHESRGNHWGPPFRALVELWRRDGETLARLRAPEETADDLAHHLFHPALLDACGQSLAATLPVEPGAVAGDDVFVLGGIDEVRFHQRPSADLLCHAALRTDGRDDSLTGDVHVFGTDGQPVADLIGLRLQYLDPTRGPARPNFVTAGTAIASNPETDSWLYQVNWEPNPVADPAAAAPTRWLLITGPGDDSVAELLRERLPGDVALASWGAEFHRTAPARFTFDPADPAQTERLLTSAAEDLPGTGPLSVVDMPTTAADRPGDGSAALCRCLALAHLVRAAAAIGHTRLGVLTRAAQPVLPTDTVPCPEEAAVWGLSRVVARENPDLACALVDLPADPDDADVTCLAAHLASGDGEDQTAVRDGARLTARLARRRPAASPTAPLPVREPLPRAATSAAPVRVHAAGDGPLGEVSLRADASPAPGPGQVAIDVSASALNFRDVLLGMGMYPGQGPQPPTLGWECAGRVSAVGTGVAGIAVGDKVLALAHPALSSRVVTDAALVVPCPTGLSAEEAATIPLVHLTAYHGLCNLAGLRAGERVLVHSATGGVGLAAIRIAQWKGAEVLATAGSPEKRALLGLMGVRHVADSRSLDFVERFRAATRGRGVDVVLNTLPGKAAEANWQLLAPYGRYVELGKRDILGGAQLDLRPFARNLSYHAVDVADMIVTRPWQAGEILHDIMDLVERGDLGPLPFSRYPAEQAAQAFSELAAARQVGKVVLTFDPAETLAEPAVVAPDEPLPAHGSSSDLTPAQPRVPQHLRPRPDATYLVTGGLGDLGRVVTDWLIDRGARHVMLVGRTPLSPDEPLDPAAAALSAWRARGVEVGYHALDVADESALQTALAERRAAGLPPVRGAVHAAGVIRYQPVMDLDADELARELRPKTAGAWTLHQALENEELDFFVLFSSGSAVLSSPMLGAYAAGNATMDALAHHRRARGLTALSVNWGFWGSVGMAARFEHEQGRPLAPQGIRSFSPAEGIAVLEFLMAADATQALVMPADWPAWAAAYPEAAASPILRGLVTAPAATVVPTTSAPPRPEPDHQPSRPTAPPPAAGDVPAAPEVASYVTERVAAVLRRPAARVPLRQPLNRLGLDSLMAVEVRNRIQRDLGVSVPVVKLLGQNTLAGLIEEVEARAGTAPQDSPGPSGDTPSPAAYEVVEL
ncbi:type I polyketide synthase [Streptomyces sp. BA2]|uniref:type I polyketide synthase n=1 Tax=Streptomyces sp. BA2 TaxID=436595 RepID=UPI0013267FC5|nr:type I polyketide synthase [Streptomyces sp. BA2]MWA16244.1 acyltransferase domain-containing protein [Streptomyces sp. BA2]